MDLFFGKEGSWTKRLGGTRLRDMNLQSSSAHPCQYLHIETRGLLLLSNYVTVNNL